jgi:primosomal protein N' (replication factor Y)
MLPPGIVGQRDMRVSLAQSDAASDNPLQQKIIDLLKRRGTLNGQQINRSVKDKQWQKATLQLRDAGIVKAESVLAPPRVKPKKIQVASLAIHPERIPHIKGHLGKYSRESDMLEAIVRTTEDDDVPPHIDEILSIHNFGETTLKKLIEDELVSVTFDGLILLEIPTEQVDDKLLEFRRGEADLGILRALARDDKPLDVSWIYAQTGTKVDDLKRLEERELIYLGEKEIFRDSLAERDFIPMSAPRLTMGQRAAWEAIRERLTPIPNPSSVDGGGVFLLHGVTGSGKTEIYLRAIEHVLSRGRQAIFLVPEIALTAQTVRRVMARFPGQTAIVHSGLNEGERYDTWRRARNGDIGVIVGARSALYTPLPDIGLVILDEEHDHSYKQSPPSFNSEVYYHTRDVAEQMMRNTNGVLILGSATPDIDSYYRAQRGEIVYLHLPDRIMGHRIRIEEQSRREKIAARYTSPPEETSDALTIPLPPVEVVDMRSELKSGNREMFSRVLQDELAETILRGEQAILYINRRGTSTYVFCRDCGYVAECPRCDTPLTFHQYSTELHCHHCGYRAPTPSVCPQCHSSRIKFFGAGTQEVEATVRKLFPSARSLRWDADTAAKPDQHDVILQRFVNRDAEILIGTQMIAKGLDLPLVTLVGVVSADMGLALPDFRANERVFQLLMQVAGRAGRGLLGGKVILQTYQPEHYVIEAAAKHDYAGFYEREIGYRRDLGYPPFRRMARILFRFDKAIKAQSEAERAAVLLKDRLEQLEMTGTEIIGPAPCFFDRVDRQYRWQILLRGPNPQQALENFHSVLGWHIDIDPLDLL